MMSLHRLTSVTMGVPNVAETAGYYTEFGLRPERDGWFATQDGGRQLRVVPAATRRLVELNIGVDDPDDLARVAARLTSLGISPHRTPTSLSAVEKATGVRATLEVATRLTQPEVPATPYNGPGRVELLLVPQGPGGQLLRVLLRHGLHHRRPAVEARGAGGGPRPVQLGSAAPALVPGPGGPGRADDRQPLGLLSTFLRWDNRVRTDY